MVFCHGTPWSSELWRPIAKALAAHFTVYLWDMPGYGESSKQPEHRVSLDVQGELFSDLLSFWELRSPHVVAHDYGGAVALRGHLLHGSAYASLALVDVVALRPWGSDFFRLVRDHADVFAALPPAVHGGALRAYIGGASHRGLTPDALDALIRPWLDDEGQAAFYRQIAEADEAVTDQVEPMYPAIDVPVLVVGVAPVLPQRRVQHLVRAVGLELQRPAHVVVQRGGERRVDRSPDAMAPQPGLTGPHPT